MTAVLAQWRTSYVPGEWVTLAGPTSLVVLLPSATGWTPLLDILWQEVLTSTSLIDLAGKLSAHGLDAMPSFGAFFWTPDGMRSLVRGAVVVRDADTGAVLARGHGIQTWSEIGLDHVDRIQIETPGASATTGLQLPLVVGAALASSLTLDARADVSVPAPIAEGEPEAAAGDPPNGAQPGSSLGQTTMADADTELWGAPLSDLADTQPGNDWPQTTTAPLPPPVTLVISDGTLVDLDQPVRIGRAPNADGAREDVRLITVRSPQQDISRTHLEVAVDDGQVVATDLHSTNGTMVTRPGATGAPERLPTGTAVPLPVGSLLDIGDNVRVRIDPSAARHDTVGDR